jgi:chromosome segregation ATPase
MSKEDILGKIAEGALSLVMEPDKVPVNGYPSTHEELDFLQEIADEFPKTIDKVIREREGEINKNNEGVVEMKKANEQLKSFIQEQRKKLGSSGSTNKPNPQDQQKIQSLQNEINSLKQTITELQAQIAELKQNQNKDNSANPEIAKKIENLESQKQQIQSELNKKQSQVNQEKNKSKTTSPVKNNQQTDNSQQSNNQDNKFN